jgi:ABC-2 type transport system ATP-binding protein
MSDAIEVTGVGRSFGEVIALNGLDLTVPAGTVFGLLGPNGAGKTTTVGMLTTRVRPTDGSARIGGVDVVRDPVSARQQLAVVPQRSNLDRSISIRDNLIFHAAYHGVPARERERRADELLAQFGLLERARDKPDFFSGGQSQRVMIARALMHEPRVLFLDEPTTGLDPASRKAVWNVLRQTVTDGTTLVFSTHYMEEAERLSDRIAIIDTGRVIAFGTVRELVSRLHDSYRLSYHDPTYSNGHGHVRVQRYATFADVQLQIKRLRLSEYSIARASLEDVYFEVAGHQFENEDEEEPAEVLQ